MAAEFDSTAANPSKSTGLKGGGIGRIKFEAIQPCSLPKACRTNPGPGFFVRRTQSAKVDHFADVGKMVDRLKF